MILKMLEKDVNARATVNELKKDKWLNEGFAVSLDSKEADFIGNYTEEELKNKGIPLHAIVFAVKIILLYD